MTLDDEILDTLQQETMTVTELHVSFGSIPRSTIGDAITRLHKARRIFICRWQRTRVTPAPVYMPGSKKDAPRPKRLTGAERTRLYREEHALEVRVKRAAKEGNPLQHYLQLLQP